MYNNDGLRNNTQSSGIHVNIDADYSLLSELHSISLLDYETP